MTDKLMTPGPTNVAPEVLRMFLKPVLGHQIQEFIDLLNDTQEKLKCVFRAEKQHVFILPGSGTLGTDASIANSIERGEKVLTLSSGYFGERVVDIVERHGGIPIRVSVEWNKVIEPRDVEEALKKDKDIKAVVIVHNETSTGVTNPIREIGEIVRNYDALYIVDAVSSLGGIDVRVDDWGIDVCVATAYKAMAAPPGLVLISCSDKVIDKLEKRESQVDTLFLDFLKWKHYVEKPQEYFSIPPTNEIYALNEALKMIEEETLQKRFERHEEMAIKVRAALKSQGLKLYPEVDDRYLSNTITVTNINPANKTNDVIEDFHKHGIIVAGGLGEKLKGNVIRVAHMGNIDENTVEKFKLLLDVIARKNKIGKYI